MKFSSSDSCLNTKSTSCGSSPPWPIQLENGVANSFRYLGDDVVEVFKGDAQGTFEVLNMLNPCIPFEYTKPHYFSVGDEEHLGGRITCIDYMQPPYCLIGTYDGRLAISKSDVQINYTFPEIRVIYQTVNEAPIIHCRNNVADPAFSLLVHSEFGTNTQTLEVVDIARGKGVSKSDVIYQRYFNENITDICWTRRDKHLIITSTSDALRVMDIRDKKLCPLALFLEGNPRLLTVSELRPELVATIVKDQVQIFDIRNLYGPVVVRDFHENLRGSYVDCMAWNPRDPYELLYSSHGSQFVARITLEPEQDCFRSRENPKNDPREIMTLDELWSAREMPPNFLIHRLSTYLPATISKPVPNYMEQLDLSVMDEDERPPNILNPLRSIVDKTPSSSTTHANVSIAEETEGSSCRDDSTVDTDKSIPRSSSKSVTKKSSQVTPDLSFDIRNERVDKQKKLVAAILNFCQRYPPEEKKQKFHELVKDPDSEEFMGYIIEPKKKPDDDPLVVGTLASQHFVPIEYDDNLNIKASVHTLDSHAEHANLANEKVLLNVMKQLTHNGLVPSKARQIEKLIRQYIENPSDITSTLVKSVCKHILEEESQKTIGQVQQLGYDYEEGFKVDIPIDSFVFPPEGCNGILVMTCNPYHRFVYIEANQKDINREMASTFKYFIQNSKLRYLYKCVPQQVYNISKLRIGVGFKKKLGKLPFWSLMHNTIFADFSTVIDEFQDFPVDDVPYYMIWAASSAAYYDGAITGDMLLEAYAEWFQAESARLAQRDSDSPSKSVRTALDEDFLDDSSTKDEISSPTEIPLTEIPGFKQHYREGRKVWRVPEEFGLLMKRTMKKVEHKFTENLNFRGIPTAPDSFDLAMKGYPGLLQLSILELETSTKLVVNWDCTTECYLNIHVSPYRHRMQLSFGLAFDDCAKNNLNVKMCTDELAYYEMMYTSLVHGKFAYFVDTMEEMVCRFGKPQVRGVNELLPLEHLETFAKLIREYTKLIILHREDEGVLEKQLKWIEECDDYVNTRSHEEYYEHLVTPMIWLLKIAVLQEDPSDYAEKIMDFEKIAFPYRLLWLFCLCDAETLHDKLMRMADEAQDLERLMYYGLGRHSDCMFILNEYLKLSHDYQLVAHLCAAGRLFESEFLQYEQMFDACQDIVEIFHNRPVKDEDEPINLQSFRIDEKNFNEMEFLREYHADPYKKASLSRYLHNFGRFAPKFHMDEVFTDNFLNVDIPIENLISALKCTCIRYMHILGAEDIWFFRYNFFRMLGNKEFKDKCLAYGDSLLTCTFCSKSRRDVVPPGANEDNKRKDQILKDRADRRRETLLAANNARVSKGEVASYVPNEDVNGTIASTTGEIKMAPVMACPHCRRPFPRCVVCQQFESTPNTEEHSCGEMSTIFVTCPKCHHGGHLMHMNSWFLKEDSCAVRDCRCRCEGASPKKRLVSWDYDEMYKESKEDFYSR